MKSFIQKYKKIVSCGLKFNKMTLKKYVAVFGIVVLVLMGCNGDDDSIVTIALNDIGEQAAVDQEKLRTYLKTHFYNKEDFSTPAAGFDGFVKFDTISGENADKTPLMDEMGLDSLMVDFGDVAHTLYVLKHRVGVAAQVQATVVDSVLLAFRGAAIYEAGFFDSTITPAWYDMTGSFLSGFKNGFKGSQGGSGAVLGADGAIDFNDDFEIGAIFMPSGLGYFNDTANGVIEAYSSLIFSYKVYQVNVADHDGDGVVSKIEALDENNEVDARDTDGDGVLDIFDTDDDGDGTPTIDEIEKSDTNGDGVIDDDDDYPDTDGDNIPDYLDSDTK